MSLAATGNLVRLQHPSVSMTASPLTVQIDMLRFRDAEATVWVPASM